MQDSEKKRERERDRETETETEKERRLSSYMWGFGCMAKRNKEVMTSSLVFILTALYPQMGCIFEGSIRNLYLPIDVVQCRQEILRRNSHLSIYVRFICV